ncbi:MAG TPA: pilus assembly protein PilP, partial [Rhodanobacteraceae bacterium]|nr:pilus assembly protein PilP [Rhodanobacteraceae bacterium]
SACGGANDDLRAYIDEVKARPGGRIEPLPPVEPAPTFKYEAGTRRSPFVPEAPQRRRSNDPNAVEGPDQNRPREFLEQFPLDTLRMVGTLADRRASFGLVQTNDGLVHRVTVGNHMGQNFGRIVSISDSEIQLVEIISDGLGGYLERPAAIGLAD